ncbi:putative TOS1-like glycosyl hydrolase-domain-containing protein [Scheffersomyces xylosifermentans]|uniref:putative TOS1-like glycosyl hydrolase-domain-containing protein n=1 Tax=Scheffersomyces xylosifermentans TaxID=1304137 RepID=UPI00315DD9D5
MKFSRSLASVVALYAAAVSTKATPSVSSSSSTATSNSKQVDVIAFDNLGFSGTYRNVESFSNIYDDDCSCVLSTDTVSFSGPNAPLNEAVSVHFRGPLQLNSFAFYTSPDFVHGASNSSAWERLAFFEASSGTAENVTFLTAAGKNSTCLGRALTFADSDGLSAADSATVLAEGTVLNSNDEFVIFSNLTCDASGANNNCGVYREGIPAYQGFDGTVKMFLFEFTMPEATSGSKDSVANWNMPAIWLLNARIPRTAQYSLNANCSCWRSGCGEFDIFEVMNSTESTHLYSTVHDYQGTDNIESGLAAYGHMLRDTTGVMRGGVAFDANGKAIVFMSNSTEFNSSISASDLSGWIKQAGAQVTDNLSSVAPASSSSTKKSSGSSGLINTENALSALVMSLFSMAFSALF